MNQIQKKLKMSVMAILFVIGCQEKKQLSDMHDSTGEMNGTTKGMNNTMTEMNNTMKAMAGTMNNMNQTFGKVSAVMNHMDGSLNETNGEIRNMGGTLQRVDGQIGNMDRTLVNVNGQIGNMDKTLVNVDSKFSDLTTTIEKVDSKIGDMNDTLTDVHTEIVDMNKVLKEVKVSMKDLVIKIDAMDGKMGNLVAQLTDMNRVITALGYDMKSMSGKLDGMSAKMGDLLGKMIEIFEIARPGMSLMLRETSWSQLKEAEELAGKLAEAAKYFMSFEYQVYLPTNEEEMIKREELAGSAANEFFLQLKDLLPNGKPNQKIFNDISLTNLNVEALSVAMHRMNEVQTDFIKKNHSKIPMLSMYSIISESLLNQKNKTNISEESKSYEKVVIENRDLAVWLLKVRLNTLVKMSIDIIPTKVHFDEKNKLMTVLSKVTSTDNINELTDKLSRVSKFVPRDIQFNAMPPEVAEKLITLFQAIIKTKKTLEAINADSSIINGLSFSLRNLNSIDSTESLTPIQTKFISAYKEFLKQVLTEPESSKEPELSKETLPPQKVQPQSSKKSDEETKSKNPSIAETSVKSTAAENVTSVKTKVAEAVTIAKSAMTDAAESIKSALTPKVITSAVVIPLPPEEKTIPVMRKRMTIIKPEESKPLPAKQ